MILIREILNISKIEKNRYLLVNVMKITSVQYYNNLHTNYHPIIINVKLYETLLRKIISFTRLWNFIHINHN